MSRHHRETRPGFATRKWLIIWSVLGLAGAGLLVWAVQLANRARVENAGGAQQRAAELARQAEQEAQRRQEQIEAFLQDGLETQLAEYQMRNAAAAERALGKLTDEIGQFRSGVPPFVEALTGWTTRFGVARRQVQELWDKYWRGQEDTKRVELRVQELFQEHVFSEDRLRSAVDGSIWGYRQDLEASRNELLAQLEHGVSTGDLPVGVQIDATQLSGLMQSEMQRMTETGREQAVDSLTVAVTSFAGGELAGFVTTTLMTAIATRIAATLSAAGSAGAGATGGSAAVGGSGGSTVGPAGTVVGLLLGLAVGMGVDYWLTERFAEQVRAQCEQMLTELEGVVVDGSVDKSLATADDQQRESAPDADTPTAAPWPGLRAIFDHSNQQAVQAARVVISRELRKAL